MPTNRAELTRLLGKADGEFGLMVELEPFFQIAEAGKYPLASASEELRLEALTALRGIFGADAATKVDGKEKLKYAWTEKIEFFSCSNNPFPEP